MASLGAILVHKLTPFGVQHATHSSSELRVEQVDDRWRDLHETSQLRGARGRVKQDDTSATCDM